MQKTQDFLQETKLSTYRTFLQSIGKSIHYTSVNLSDIEKNIYELYLFLPKEYWGHLDALVSSIYEQNFDKTQLDLIEISKILSNDLNCNQNTIDEQTPS